MEYILEMKSELMNNFIDFAVKMIQLCDESDFEQLNELLVEAERFFLNEDEVEKLIKLYIVLHEQIHSKGNIEKLMEYLERFIAFYELSNINVEKNHYLSSKAFLEHIRGNEKEVLIQIQAAYEENEKANNVIAKVAILNNMAYTYFLLERYEESFNISIQAEKIIEEYHLNGTFVHYKIGINLAKVYIKKQLLNEAKKYLDLVVEFDEFKTSVVERIDYYATYAEYEASIGLVTDAIEHYKVAITHSEENNMYIEQRAYYRGLLKILNLNKYFEDAKIYQEKYDWLLEDLETKNKNLTNKKIIIDSEIKQRLRFEKFSKKNKKLIRKDQFTDELTEFYNEVYMTELIQKIRMNKLFKKPQFVIFLKLDELKPILEEHGKIYAEKMVYEVSKYIHAVFDNQIVGRTRFNEFLIINRSISANSICDTIETLKLGVQNERVMLSKKAYKLTIIGSFVDLRELFEIKQVKKIELEHLIQILRDQATASIEKISEKNI